MPDACRVSNTGPLIALAEIGQFPLLRALYGELIIPPAVRAEAQDPTVSAAIDAALAAGWVKITVPRDLLAVQILRRDLDPGESEALIVAKENRADLVIVDDLDARRMAQALGLTFIGTLGVLLAAKVDNHIPAVKPLIERLRASDFRMSAELSAYILTRAGETA
jgi:uncharacterized protein